MNIVGNLYVSNGMLQEHNEARVQGLSEVFERFVKNKIMLKVLAYRLSLLTSWLVILR